MTEWGDASQALAAARSETLERMRGLERDFQAIVESSSAGTDDEHDPEGATVAFERQHAAALLEQARDHLAKIDRAVQRLDEGSYGICERCGGPIGAARLAARPVATTCIGCTAGKRPPRGRR